MTQESPTNAVIVRLNLALTGFLSQQQVDALGSPPAIFYPLDLYNVCLNYVISLQRIVDSENAEKKKNIAT